MARLLPSAGTAGPTSATMGVDFQDSEFNAVDTDTLSLGVDVGRFYSENL